jgi:hypothetical protein
MKRKQKNYQTRLAWMLSGLAFFILMTTYAIIKLDATMNRPRELPIENITNSVEDPREDIIEKDKINQAKEIANKMNQKTTNKTLIELKKETQQEDQSDIENWKNAENILLKYFENINIGNYAEAVESRTPDYLVGTAEAYALQLENSMTNDIAGKLKITEITQIPELSKLTTKYFRFRKDSVWSFDNSKHSEIRKAAIVLRDGEWTIDFFEVERKF